jgi:hypothetical protein
VPDELLSRPFTVTEARRLGVSPAVLRGEQFRTPVRGVRASTVLPDSLEQRCLAVSALMPGVVLSHGTAAALCDLPVPVLSHVVEVTAVGGCRLTGVRGHRRDPGDDVRTLPSGLRVTSGARTWADHGVRLELDDLVVLGDAVLRHGWADQAALTAAAAVPGRRGARRLRTALGLLEPRTDSPMETRLRLLVVRSGLPRPVAGRDVVVDGSWLARPDLSWPALRIAVEYDGDHHRTDRTQWQRDIARRRLLEDAGWTLVVVTSDDVLRHPDLLVARLRRLVDQRSR